MDSKNIFDYILKLEVDNKELLNNKINLMKTVDDLREELDNLKKVSIMINFNKQLKEKENIISTLENEIRNIKRKSMEENKLIKPIEVKPIESEIKHVEVVKPTEVEIKPVEVVKSTEVEIKHVEEVKPTEVEIKVTEIVEENKVNKSKKEKVKKPVEEEQVKKTVEEEQVKKPVEEEQNEKPVEKKKKKQKNCEIIKYKSNEYLLNNDTNEIFNVDDKKLTESIGMLKNGKVKFYKKE